MTFDNDDYELRSTSAGYVWRCRRCEYVPERVYGPSEWFGSVVAHYRSKHPSEALS